MNKLAEIVGKKVGEAVEDAVKGTLHLGGKDKEKDKNKKKGGGGISSLFGGDKDKKKKQEDKGISNVFHRDNEDEIERRSGFKGLFTEAPLTEVTGDNDGPAMEAEGEENPKPQSEAAIDGDLLDDLLDVAEEKPHPDL